MAAERLQKYLARAGVASRRHAEELITAGRVTVNNEKVTELGSKVSPGDLVTVDGQLVEPPDESSYFLLYKPVGVVTTLSDPQGRPTVADYIEQSGKRLFPVGRLDYDAEGALLVTNDGELAHKLTHPSFQVPRTYLAKVKGTPDAATLDKLRGGVRLEDGMATPVSVDVFEQAERNTWLKLVVAEGRPHLIKRLCAAVGYPVVRLYRPSYAGVTVEGLRPGTMRPLTESEVRRLTEVADGKATPHDRELKLPPRRHGRSAPGFEVEGGDDEDFGEEAPAPVKSRVAAKPKPARAARAERPTRGADREERPARAASRPERKELGPRGEGGARPAFRSASGGRAERRTWTPREEEHEEGQGGRPERESAPRGEERESRGARPERREWAPRGGAERGARPVRKTFGAGGGAERRGPPRGEGGERPERGARKPFGFGGGAERGERPERGARKPFGFGGAERRGPPRGEGGERPERGARKPFGFSGGAERRGPPREGGERSERGARKPFGFGGGAERRGPPRGEGGERPERGARKPFGFGGGAERRGPPRGEGGERPERGARKPFGFGGGAGAERRGPPRGERPERREWAPRGEERGERGARPGPRGAGGARPERKTWAPAGEGAGRPARRGAARPGGEGATGEAGGYVNWRAKKPQGPKAEWEARPPRGGAGGPPRGRGPRKGR